MEGQVTDKLMLLFYVGDELFACDAEPVIEIVPKVHLKEIPFSPKPFVGLLNFNGTTIPVVDFCEMIAKRAASISLHTRIILLTNPDPEASLLKVIGLIAEKVTETTVLKESFFVNPGIQVKDASYLGGVISSGKETVQFISIKELFKELERTQEASV